MTYRGVDVPPSARTALDALSLLSKKWHPVVLLVLSHRGPMGFNELLTAIPDLSGKVLSGTLESLGEAGLVDRTVVNEAPLRVEYALTDAGADMEPVFRALSEWGERHREPATPTVLLADADRRLTDMYGQWLSDRYAVVRAHTGAELSAALGDDVDVLVYHDAVPGSDPGPLLDAVGSCRTVALVGDRPAFDLLDVPFDDVRRQPILRADLLDAVEAQLTRRGESPVERERASLAARRSALESVYSSDRLEASEVYVDLRDRLRALDEGADRA